MGYGDAAKDDFCFLDIIFVIVAMANFSPRNNDGNFMRNINEVFSLKGYGKAVKINKNIITRLLGGA